MARLRIRGFRIPKTYACTWEAYEKYKQGDQTILVAIRDELEQMLKPERSYAVRSSANIEDGLERSFAGQFRTLLCVSGAHAVLQAMQEVWEQTQTSGVRAYLERHSLSTKDLEMAVIIQEMVNPIVSGVSFSRNPLTGVHEIVVEAVHGSGEALVQEGITPARWVNKRGVWAILPDDREIETGLIEKVVRGTQQIAKVFKMDVDLEWVYDGEHLYWLQLREITAIKGLKVYSNRIAKEVLPGVIKPLIWSVNTPLVNGAWVSLITEVIGENDIQPNDLSKAFYYRTYFDMGTFGRIFNLLGLPDESLEMMMGINPEGAGRPSFKPSFRMLAILPRLLAFLLDKWRFSNKIEHDLPKLEARFRGLPISAEDLDERELLVAIDQHFEVAQEMAYFNIVVPLLMNFYNALLRRQLGGLGIDYESFDLAHGLDGLVNYDPGFYLASLNYQFEQLDRHLQDQIRNSNYAELKDMPGIEGFLRSLTEFMVLFGHLSDSGNDFSSVPWRENPDMILNLVLSYSRPEENKHVRMNFDRLPVRGLRRWLLSILYGRARRYRLHREQVSSMYTYGYGLFRNLYLAIGERLVTNSRLSNAEDVFFLYDQEIRAVIEGHDLASDLHSLVEQRKREIKSYQDIELPSVIYGEQAPPVSVVRANVLYGTATSRGYYSGRVKVIRGMADFSKLADGDVLVVPFSDVGWTPLFGKAGAVIAESGGMLSHSSIIAREYQIPAVVSVKGAMQLKDDMLVSVDGYRGEVVIQQSNIKP